MKQLIVLLATVILGVGISGVIVGMGDSVSGTADTVTGTIATYLGTDQIQSIAGGGN